MATIFTTRLNVRSYELISFGHVNNATYLNYLEYARGDYLRQRGCLCRFSPMGCQALRGPCGDQLSNVLPGA